MVEDFKLLYDQGPIDSIEIKYSQWAALKCQNLVDLKEYSHLRLLTQDQIGSQDFMTQCLETIVSKHRKVHWKECDDKFHEATGGNHKISDVFEFFEDDMKKFLEKKGCFDIDDEGYVTLKKNNHTQTETKSPRKKQSKT